MAELRFPQDSAPHRSKLWPIWLTMRSGSTEVGIERPDEDRQSGVVDVGPEGIDEHPWTVAVTVTVPSRFGVTMLGSGMLRVIEVPLFMFVSR